MAYNAITFVAGEQPSVTKWNYIGSNDAGFKDGTNIDANAITMAHLHNPYAFRAFHNTTQTINGVTQVTLNTEVFDTNGNFATNAYTIPVTGQYMFGGGVNIGADDARMYCYIDVDGTLYDRGSETTKRSAHTCGLFDLTAAQVVKLYCTTAASQTAGGGNDDTHFWGFLVNRT